MSRKLRLFLFIGGGILAVLLLVLACLYWASRHEPAFYRRALAVDAAKRQMLSDEMLRHALEFESKIQREGKWQATFTAEQINGWLGYDLPRNHPQTLSAEFRDPCVSIEPNRMQFGCLYDNGMTSSVLSLAVEPYVPQPNVLALRIVRAGRARSRCRSTTCSAAFPKRRRIPDAASIGVKSTAIPSRSSLSPRPTRKANWRLKSTPCGWATGKFSFRGARRETANENDE